LWRCPEENTENCSKVGDCGKNFNQTPDLYCERGSPFIIIHYKENELFVSHIITFLDRKSALFVLVWWLRDVTAKAVNTN